MSWALVNRIEMALTLGEWTGTPPNQVYEVNEIQAEPGTIINLIAYNGTDVYTPPENMDLIEVPDTAKVGDTGY